MRKRVFLFLAVTLLSTMCFAQTVESFKQYKYRVTVTLQKGVLQIYPLTSNTARIQYAEKAEPLGEELILTSRVKTPVYRISNKKEALEIILPQLVVSVDKSTGLLSYRNERGIIFLSEKAGTRLLRDSSVQGEKCYQAGQGFSSPADEYLYGCGQFQDGYLNIRGLSRRLT